MVLSREFIPILPSHDPLLPLASWRYSRCKSPFALWFLSLSFSMQLLLLLKFKEEKGKLHYHFSALKLFLPGSSSIEAQAQGDRHHQSFNMAYYDFPGTVVVIMVEKPPQENQEVLEPQAQQGNGVGNQNERLEIVVAYPPQVDPKGLDPELIERVQVLEQKTNGFAEVKRVQVLEEQTKQFADIQKVQDLEEQTKQFARRVQILEEQTKQFATVKDLKEQTKQFATIKNLEEQTKQFAKVEDLEAQTSQFATVERVVKLEKTTTRCGEVEAVEAVKKELREVVYQFCQCLFPSTAGIIGGLWLSMPCGYGGILAVILVSLVIFLLGAISCYKMWVTYEDYKRRNEGSGFRQWWGIAWPYVAHLVLIVVATTVLAAMIGAKAYNHQCITRDPPEPLTPNLQPDLQGFAMNM